MQDGFRRALGFGYLDAGKTGLCLIWRGESACFSDFLSTFMMAEMLGRHNPNRVSAASPLG
jgi:hypothetical protein